jgi:hypothetical protein
MAEAMRCPSCGETERLAGTPVAGDIEVSCQACGHQWLRGSPRCRGCGGGDVVTKLRLMTRHPRGNQLAVVGHRQVPLCPRCDADVVQGGDGRLVPEGYVSRRPSGSAAPRLSTSARCWATPTGRPAACGPSSP